MRLINVGALVDVPIEYRDRPEGSESKLSTFGDGAKVLKAIASLFKEYKPLAFFAWISLILIALGLIVGIPVITAFLATGVVLRIPSTILAVGLVFCGCLPLPPVLFLIPSLRRAVSSGRLKCIGSWRKDAK